MTRMRKISAILLAATLALVGGITLAPLASAVPSLKIDPGELGDDYIKPTVITVDNCMDRAVFSAVTYEITYVKTGAVVGKGAADDEVNQAGVLVSRTITIFSLKPGVYSVNVTCLRYEEVIDVQAAPLDSVSQEFVVTATGLELDGGDPFKGGQVTFLSVGKLDTGEQVKLVLTDETGTITMDKNGQTVGEPREAKVLKTWPTTALVGSSEVWTYTVADFPALDPKRAYRVTAVGLTSGNTVSRFVGAFGARYSNGLPDTGN